MDPVADEYGGGEVATLPRTASLGGDPLGPPAVDPRAGAFLDFVGWHRSQIELLCAQVTDRRDDAKAAIQRALVVIWHRLEDGLAAPVPSMWLYRQVRNAAVEVAHGRASAPEPGPAAVAMPESGDAAAVRAIVLRLRPEFRSALVLADVLGLDEAQVAEIEGVSLAAAATLVAGSRKAVAWGVNGGGGEVALGADGMFDLGWLTTPADPVLPAPPPERVRTALAALATPGLWDRTWDFYLSQAMSSPDHVAAAAMLGSFLSPAQPPPPPAPAGRDRRKLLLVLGAVLALVVGVGTVVAATRGSDEAPVSSLAAASGGDGSGGDEGPAAKSATTRKKSSSGSSTTAGEDEEAADAALADGEEGDALGEGTDGDLGEGDLALDSGEFDEGELDLSEFDFSEFDEGFNEGFDEGAFGDGAFDGTFDEGFDDGSTDFYGGYDPDSVIVEGDDPYRATSPGGSTSSGTLASGAPAAPAPLKVLAAADSGSIKLRWTGAAAGATGVRLRWTCCTPQVATVAGPMAVSGEHTITGLRPSTTYRVTLEVDGVDPARNAMTVVIRTTAAPTTSTRPPTTTTTATPTTPTTAGTTTTTSPGEYDVPGGIPTPDGPSAGG